MRFPRSTWIPLLVIFCVAGCGGDDDGGVMEPDPITVADFVGSWTAASVVFTSNADAGQQVDIVALGGEVRSTVLSGGGTRTWIETTGTSDEWDSQMTVSGSTVTMVPAEAGRPTRMYTYSFAGPDNLTLTDTGSEFDFTLGGAAPVPATEVIRFVRN